MPKVLRIPHFAAGCAIRLTVLVHTVLEAFESGPHLYSRSSGKTYDYEVRMEVDNSKRMSDSTSCFSMSTRKEETINV